MAPRRGGGSSYSSSSSSSSNACSSNGGFQDTYSRVQVAFQAIWLALGLGLLLYYLFTSRKSGVRKAAPFYLYGLALLFWVIVIVLGLVQLIFSQCDIGTAMSLQNIGIGLSWVYVLMILFLLATAMFPLCSALFNAAQSRSWRLLKWIHVAAFVVVAVITIAQVALYTYYVKSLFTRSTRLQVSRWQLITVRFETAVNFITFLVVILTGVSLLLAWSAGRKSGNRKSGLLPWIIIFVVAFALDFLIIFGQDAATLSGNGQDRDVLLALFIIRRCLEFLVFVAVLAMAGRAVSAASPVTNDKPYQYAPYTSNGSPEATHYQPQSTFPPSQQPQTVYAQNGNPQPPQQHQYPRPPSPQQYSRQSQPSHDSYYSTSPSPRPAPAPATAPESVPLVNSQQPHQQSYQAYRP